MATWRDMTVAYTEEEITNIVEACRRFPDFKDDSISTTDFVHLVKEMRNERSTEQLKAYEQYFDKYCGGRLSLEGVVGILRSQHKPSLHAEWYAKECDVNKDGIISKSEFEQIYELMAVQWPEVSGKTYDEFIVEADTDKSGDVDIGEFVTWLKKHSNFK